MNSQKVIEVKPGDPEGSIGTSSLGGCLAVAVIIEDGKGVRRCGLAHWDPMSLRLELEKNNKLTTIQTLFNSTAQVDSKNLTHSAVLVMSENPEIQKEFVEQIQTEARHLLGVNKTRLIKYGNVMSERLDIKLPSTLEDIPTYSTAEISATKVW